MPAYSNAFVQAVSGLFVTQSSKAQAFTNPVTSGNLMVVLASYQSASTATISDTLTSTWHQIFLDNTTFAQPNILIAWWATAPSTGANTITVGFGSSVTSAIGIAEFQCQGNVDQSSKATGTSTTWATPSQTTTHANELLVGFIGVQGSITNVSTPFVLRSTLSLSGTNFGAIVESGQPTTGTFNVSGTQGSAAWIAYQITFFTATFNASTSLPLVPSNVNGPLGYEFTPTNRFPPAPSAGTPPSGHALYNILGTSGSVQQINVPGGNVTSGGPLIVDV